MTKKINKYACYLILLIPIIYSFTILQNKECDIWFLFSHGRYVLNHGFPHVDFLSMHSNLHFVMQQWLSSVIFYLTYKALGTIGIYILVWVSNILIVFLLYKLCMKISNNLFVSCVITAIIDSLLCLASVVARPLTFSSIIFILILYIMESYRKKESKVIYWLIPISLLEINLHASLWPVLFVLLAPYVVHYFILYSKDKNKTIFKLLGIILAMILVGFINPYGIENMTYSLRSYGVRDINSVIWEMKGLSLSGEYAYANFFGYIAFFIMIGVTYIFIKTKKKVEIYKLLLFYGTFYMALLNIRNNSIFYIVSLTSCIEYINFKVKYVKDFNLRYKIIYALMIALTASVIVINKDKYVLSDEYLGQRKVLEYMEKHVSKDEPIYTMSSNGGFYSYYGYKTYMDTRAEVFLKVNNRKEDLFHEFYLYLNDKLDYNEFLRKYNFKYLVIDEEEPMHRFLESVENTDYNLLYVDKKTLLYKKRD